jgi:hypothetical protein
MANMSGLYHKVLDELYHRRGSKIVVNAAFAAADWRASVYKSFLRQISIIKGT